MILKDNLNDKYRFKNYPPLKLHSIAGHQCRSCGEVVLTRQSSREIDAKVMAHRAIYDAQKTTAARLMLISTAAALLHLTRQAIHKMMREGRLAYVFIDDLRFPLRSAVMQYRHSRRR